MAWCGQQKGRVEVENRLVLFCAELFCMPIRKKFSKGISDSVRELETKEWQYGSNNHVHSDCRERLS